MRTSLRAPTIHFYRNTMKKLIIATLAAFAAFAVVTPALADVKLATDKNCMSCHSVDKKVVGPGYKDIAAKYAGQKDAVDMLAGKILKGGAGVWGPIPMPANAQVNAAEAKTLATWVMSLK
jgi:cytochrome c